VSGLLAKIGLEPRDGSIRFADLGGEVGDANGTVSQVGRPR
jgi:hypothetical protein